LHVGVALDQNAMTMAGVDAAAIKQLVTATAGIDKARGDTVAINAIAFDRTAEKAAAKELASADHAAAAAQRRQQFKEVGLALAVVGQLSETEVEAVSTEIARLEAIEASESESVLEEFRDLLVARRHMAQGGIGVARQILEETLGHDRAAEIIERLTAAAVKS